MSQTITQPAIETQHFSGGEWRCETVSEHVVSVRADNVPVARVFGNSLEETQANGRLIVESKEMFRRLAEVDANWRTGNHRDGKLWREIVALLRRVQGEGGGDAKA